MAAPHPALHHAPSPPLAPPLLHHRSSSLPFLHHPPVSSLPFPPRCLLAKLSQSNHPAPHPRRCPHADVASGRASSSYPPPPRRWNSDRLPSSPLPPLPPLRW